MSIADHREVSNKGTNGRLSHERDCPHWKQLDVDELMRVTILPLCEKHNL